MLEKMSLRNAPGCGRYPVKLNPKNRHSKPALPKLWGGYCYQHTSSFRCAAQVGTIGHLLVTLLLSVPYLRDFTHLCFKTNQPMSSLLTTAGQSSKGNSLHPS